MDFYLKPSKLAQPQRAVQLKGSKHECNTTLPDGTFESSGKHGKRQGACDGLSADIQTYYLNSGSSTTVWKNYANHTCNIMLDDGSGNRQNLDVSCD